MQAELTQAKARIAELEAQVAQDRPHSTFDNRMLHYIAQYSLDMFALINRDGSVDYVSAAFNTMIGYSSDAFKQLDLLELVHVDDREMVITVMHDVLAVQAERRMFEVRVRHQDGHWIWLEVVVINHLENLDLQAIQINCRDITNRKAQENRLRILNRTLELTTGVNQAIIRIRSIPNLFEHVCRIAVENGGFRMAWVGVFDPETKRVNPVASTGFTDNYLDKINIVIDGSPHGKGPTGIAMTIGQHAVAENIEHDPHMEPWREQALRMGYRASAAFPLKVAGETRAVLSLYAHKADFFDSEELALLDEMAEDISFAMEFAEQETQRQEAERKHFESEERFRATFEQAAVGIAHVAPDGRWLRVNQGLCDILGFTREELLEKYFQEITFAEDLDADLDIVWQMLTSKQSFRSAEKRYVHKNGHIIWTQLTVSLVRSEDGTAQYFIVIIEDISDRKQAEAAITELNENLEARVIERTTELNRIKTRIESILNSNADSIVYSRIDGSIEHVNPAFTRIFGYQSDEIMFKPISQLVQSEQVNELKRVFDNVVSLRSLQSIDVIALRKDGQPFDAAIMLSPVLENGDTLFGVVASVHDVTDRNIMLRHAMELNELKSRYVSMAAHDLRNPMALILTSADTLEAYWSRLSEEKRQDKFAQIKNSIKVMTDILNDVLVMGQADSGKLEFSPSFMNVTEFCQTIILETTQIMGNAIGIEFSVEGVNGLVRMDAKLLRHILTNLFSNALKYSISGGRVIFKVCKVAEQVIFHIQDQGIGIPKSEQVHIFETFHRASNARHLHGTGLGLAIVKRSVDLHGGTITFESEEGHGTTFIVTIPVDINIGFKGSK